MGSNISSPPDQSPALIQACDELLDGAESDLASALLLGNSVETEVSADEYGIKYDEVWALGS